MKTRNWEDFSAKAINEIVDLCHSNPAIMLVDLLPKLADIRCEAAIELGHKDERGPKVFGAPIPEGRNGAELQGVFNNYIFMLLYNHSNSTDESRVKFRCRTQKLGGFSYFEYNVPYPKHAKEDSIDLSDAELMKILHYMVYTLGMDSRSLELLKSCLNPDAHPLSKIIIQRDDTINSDQGVHHGLEMMLNYPKNDLYGAFHHFTFLEKCFKKLVSWQKEDAIDDFISTSAKLIYMMVHRFPFRRGTSSIAEWVIRGLGEFKGIKFPDKFHEESEDWRWRALMQSDCEVFAKWFIETISPKIKLTSTTVQLQSADPRLFSSSSSAAVAASAAAAAASADVPVTNIRQGRL